MDIKLIKLTDIVIQKQVRTIFNPESLKSLAASIKEKGVLLPVLVKPLGDKYLLVSGERRYLASQEAGLKSINACILDNSDNEKEIQLIENTQREDLNPLELANAFADLRNEGRTVDEIAVLVGKKTRYVEEILSLLELTDEEKEKIKTGEAYTRFSRQKSKKTNEKDSDINNLSQNDITPNKMHNVHSYGESHKSKETQENQEVIMENIPTSEDRKPKIPLTKDRKPRNHEIANTTESIYVDPETVLNTGTITPDYSNMPEEQISIEGIEDEYVLVSPESLVNEAGQMIDMQNRPVYELEDEGYVAIIKPSDVNELIEKFNETGYGIKIKLGGKDAIILTEIGDILSLYNIVTCLAVNLKDFIVVTNA